MDQTIFNYFWGKMQLFVPFNLLLLLRMIYYFNMWLSSNVHLFVSRTTILNKKTHFRDLLIICQSQASFILALLRKIFCCISLRESWKTKKRDLFIRQKLIGCDSYAIAGSYRFNVFNMDQTLPNTLEIGIVFQFRHKQVCYPIKSTTFFTLLPTILDHYREKLLKISF